MSTDGGGGGGGGSAAGTQGGTDESSRPGPPPVDGSIFTLSYFALDDTAPRSEAALGRLKYNYILTVHPTFAPRDPTPQEIQARATHLERMKNSKRPAANADFKKLANLLEKEGFQKWQQFLRKILGNMEFYMVECKHTGFHYDWILLGLRHWQSKIKRETGGTMGELTLELEEHDMGHLINQMEP